MKESAREPTTSKELVMGYPEFLGWLDESGEGVGGGWIPEKKCTGTNNLALGISKEIAGQADHANKPRGVLGYKRSVNGRKASSMACVGRNSWHQKPLL